MTRPRMFATLLETPGNPAPKPGDPVLIEVPLNCTIHSADAARLARLRTNAALIRDQLAAGATIASLEPLVRRIANLADENLTVDELPHPAEVA